MSDYPDTDAKFVLAQVVCMWLEAHQPDSTDETRADEMDALLDGKLIEHGLIPDDDEILFGASEDGQSVWVARVGFDASFAVDKTGTVIQY